MLQSSFCYPPDPQQRLGYCKVRFIPFTEHNLIHRFGVRATQTITRRTRVPAGSSRYDTASKIRPPLLNLEKNIHSASCRIFSGHANPIVYTEGIRNPK